MTLNKRGDGSGVVAPGSDRSTIPNVTAAKRSGQGKPAQPQAAQEFVKRYLELDWVTLPITKAGRKHPLDKDWPDLPAETDPTQYTHGIFLVTGKRSGVSAIDLDGHQYDERFKELLNQHQTPYAATPSGGAHILVAYSSAEWWGNKVGMAPELDLRNDRGGIVLPSGETDRYWGAGRAPWEVDLADPRPFEELLQELTPTKTATGAKTGSDRSTLAELMAEPAAEGGRNAWLTQVGGHLAPLIPWEDGWLGVVQAINRGLPEPLDSDEVSQTVGKLWARDQKQRPDDPNQPWTIQGGDLYYWKNNKPQLWFKPAPKLVTQRMSIDGKPSWELRNGDRTVVIRPTEIYNTRLLSIALANIKTKVSAGAAPFGENGNKVVDWLEAQDAPSIVEYPHWGWNDGHGWVGLDDEAEGPSGYQPIIGSIDRPDIIEQLPTWQEPEVAAVFCSWVALQAAKGKAPYSIEPNMVLEGAAGSGKTRGLFNFAGRLTGSERNAINTVPSLRDQIAGHRNGIVVVDDNSDIGADGKTMDLYRASSTSDSLSNKKPGADGWEQNKIPLVGSVLVSGESLPGFSNDRAARDRSVILEVEPANERKSLIDPDRAQWEDIQQVFDDLGGSDERTAHQLAGPFIKKILQAVEQIGVPEINSGDRVAIKYALLQYGAQLWQEAYPGSRTDDGSTLPAAVDRWCEKQDTSSGWRSLTLIRLILPEILTSPDHSFHGVWRKGEMLEVHVATVGKYWRSTHKDPRNQELGSDDNLVRELRQIKGEKLAKTALRWRHKNPKIKSEKLRLWELDGVVARHIGDRIGVHFDDPDTYPDTTAGAERLNLGESA